MNPKDLIGKPIRDNDWVTTKYFIPERIALGGYAAYVGTSYKFNGDVVEEDEWSVDCAWVLAYDLAAELEIDRLLEE
jgi:hypothetical protein